MIERLPVEERHESMRGYFAHALHDQMRKNNDVWVVSVDLGYGMFDRIRQDFPDRFINTGAAEQAALGISVGLAKENKVPFVYSITPFLLYRPFETVRNYVHNEGINVNLVGGGRDRDYSHDGYSHWAEEDRKIMEQLDGIKSFWPERKADVNWLVPQAVRDEKPYYINLRR